MIAVELLLLALMGCSRDPTQGSLSENVGQAFAPCSEAEIRFLATKHNFMPAFRPCGNNHFSDFAWSPDGRQLYFQLGMAHHVMDADSQTKDTRVVPTSSPVGPAAWISSSRLVVPIAPAADAPEGAPLRLALYDTDQASVFSIDLPADLKDPKDLQRDSTQQSILLTAVRGQGERRVYRVDLGSGELTEPWSWLGPVETFTFTPSQNAVTVGASGKVTVHDAESGEPRGTWAPALRGSLHPDGRWVMLEHLGDPVSIFYQRAWDELSEQARERELRRAKRFEEQLPESYPTEVQPPTLSFADLASGARWTLSSVYGTDFEWYEPTDHFGSFVLWGFEGKQFKRNVLLGDFTARMRSAEQGRDFMGVHRFGEAEGATFEAPKAPEALPQAAP